MRRRLSLLSMLSLVGCGVEQPTAERLGQQRAPMYRGTDDDNLPARDTSNALTGPSAAVGSIGFCSAVAITRNIAVTARHCFCDPDSLNFFFTLPQDYIDASGTPQTQWQTTVVWKERHPDAFDICTHEYATLSKLGAGVADITVLFLQDSIPPEVLPELPDIDLGGSVLTRAADLGKHVFVQVGFGGTKWLSTENAGTRREGFIGTDTLNYQINTREIWGMYLEADADCYTCDPVLGEPQSTFAKGDSGGGLFLQALDANDHFVGRPILVGIISEGTNYGALQYQSWAATGNIPFWANGEGDPTSNASLIGQFLGSDVDQDGIFDNADNCVPPACFGNCANPDQLDSDQDGRGDACDSCPTIADYGSDRDKDGLGDVCDVCPLCAGCDRSDPDVDGVGTACDNCPIDQNLPPVCATDADCITKPDDFCVREHGNPNGRCAYQVDDGDHDGLGDQCDPCPGNGNDGNFGIFANSNWQTETHFNAPEVIDVCDEVPVYVSRPIVGPLEDTFADGVRFFASSSIGASSDTMVKSFTDKPVTFRHCDCYDTDGNLQARDDCLMNTCMVGVNDFSLQPNMWRRITISTAGGQPIFPATNQTPTFPKRTFTSTASVVDTFPHPFDELPPEDELETGRLGATETITWHWRTDIATNHIVGHPIGAPPLEQKTGGVFESVVMPGSPIPGRDTAFNQQIRRMHTYFQTPLVVEPPWANVVQPTFDPCGFMPCSILLQPEMPRINPIPEVDPFYSLPGPIQVVVLGGNIYWAGNSPSVGDGTVLLSSALQSLLLTGEMQWLRPIERAVTATQLGATTQFVALPNAWTPSAPIQAIVFDDGVYKLRGELTHPLVAMAPLGANATSITGPTARNGARGLFSLARKRVFMVGGQRPSGRTTGEVWHYDLSTQEWTEDIFSAVRMEDVRAAAYDGSTDQLLVLQRVHPRNLPQHIFRMQLVVLNYRTQRGYVVDEWPVANTFERISLTARQDGTYVFLGSTSNGQHVKAYRFRLNGNTIEWLGISTIPGRLLDEPAVTNAGIVAPMLHSGNHVMKMLTDKDFVPPKKGWVTL